jgi:hypothetical protein
VPYLADVMQHVSFAVMQGPFYPKRSDRSYFIIEWQPQRTCKIFPKCLIFISNYQEIGSNLGSEWATPSCLLYLPQFALATTNKRLKLQ